MRYVQNWADFYTTKGITVLVTPLIYPAQFSDLEDKSSVELGDEYTYTQLGMNALYQIATLPEPERTFVFYIYANPVNRIIKQDKLRT